MESTIHLRNETSELAITIEDYENKDEALASGDSWLRCAFSVDVGPFQGTYGGSLTTDEISALAQELDTIVSTLEGSIIFESMEPGLRFEIQMGRRGDAVVKGCATPTGPPAVTVSFQFDTDQTFLRRASLDAKSVAALFPRLK